jgi:hypothetical protein
VTSIEPENQDGDVVADSFVIKDIAEFLAPLDEALFSDFLQLASYLNSEGYKDAAAVICGGVLEGHLRKLSEKLGIAAVAENGLPNKADALNRELAVKGAYSKIDEKNVTAWLNLRNYAVRGEYDRYERDDVAALLKGIRGLLGQYPA